MNKPIPSIGMLVPIELVDQVQHLIDQWVSSPFVSEDVEFLDSMLHAAEHGIPVSNIAVNRLRKMADWADTPAPPGWDGTLDRGETKRAVDCALRLLKAAEA